MELEFLKIGSYSFVSDYLQHITEMINVKLDPGDTTKILFEKMGDIFPENENKQNAVKEWVDFNINSQDDGTVFDQVLVEDGEYDFEVYASFNLRT
jgi:hypothetical protein